MFIMSKCGGWERRYLEDLIDFHTAYVETSVRIVSGDIFAASADIPLSNCLTPF